MTREEVEGMLAVHEAMGLIGSQGDRVARALIAAWDREAKLLEALAFYADVADYKAPFTGAMGKLWNDCGETARTALKS